MNAKKFLEDCKSDWVKSLGTTEKILLANLMERYLSYSIQDSGGMSVTRLMSIDEIKEEYPSSCIEEIIQREAEYLIPRLPIKRGAAHVTGVVIGGEVEMYSHSQKKYISVAEWNAENNEMKLGFEWAKPPGYDKWKEGKFDPDYDGRIPE